jgi:hypothetical protein
VRRQRRHFGAARRLLEDGTTWEALTAQLLAATFVLGSYVAAEQLRKRRRRVILARA